MIWLAAFLTGLGGSLHCLGMCGPIMVALPGNGGTAFYAGRLLYHSGRIFIYALMGMVMGLAGQGLLFAGLQQTISIAAGIFIILTGIGLLHFRSSFPRSVKIWFNKLSQQKGYGSMLAMGMLNGLLPCGLVYIALAGAVVTQNWLQGAAYMSVFGLGTFPLMYAVSLVPAFLDLKKKMQLRKMLPVLSIVVGCLFVIRGLGLGIPYLSPKYNAEKQQMECCGSQGFE